MKISTKFNIGDVVYTANMVHRPPKCEHCGNSMYEVEDIDTNPAYWKENVDKHTITDIYLHIDEKGEVSKEYQLSNQWHRAEEQKFFTTRKAAVEAAKLIRTDWEDKNGD